MSEQFDLAEFRKERDEQRKATGRFTPKVVDLLAAYESGERNLSAANLSAADLRAANLRAADLSDANLRDANLYAANLYAANLSAADLRAADLSAADLSDAHLRDANLYAANLSAADLSDADLYAANLRAAIGIYSAFGLNLSSRHAPLLGGVEIHDGKIELFLVAGCTGHISPALLREKVEKKHGKNIHAKHYMLAIDYIVGAFEIDMAEGKWNYLLELNKGKPE